MEQLTHIRDRALAVIYNHFELLEFEGGSAITIRQPVAGSRIAR
jgi:hypothetical protein